jgi:hypothetical protein
MGEVQLLKVRSAYGEIAGILSQIPLGKEQGIVHAQTINQFNSAVEELSTAAATDYSRFKLVAEDSYDGRDYLTDIVRPRIGALIKKLEEEYGFGNSGSSNTTPIVLNVTQNQQLTVSVTPIQQLIESTANEDIRSKLEELKRLLETGRDQKAASDILNSLQKKSWEVFIKVLPYVLEHWQHMQKHS